MKQIPLFNDQEAADKAAELNPDFAPGTKLHSDLCAGIAQLKKRKEND